MFGWVGYGSVRNVIFGHTWFSFIRLGYKFIFAQNYGVGQSRPLVWPSVWVWLSLRDRYRVEFRFFSSKGRLVFDPGHLEFLSLEKIENSKPQFEQF